MIINNNNIINKIIKIKINNDNLINNNNFYLLK